MVPLRLSNGLFGESLISVYVFDLIMRMSLPVGLSMRQIQKVHLIGRFEVLTLEESHALRIIFFPGVPTHVTSSPTAVGIGVENFFYLRNAVAFDQCKPSLTTAAITLNRLITSTF